MSDNGDIHIESEEGFKPLVDLTKSVEDDVQREAVWALAILASNSSCQARIEQEVGWHNFRKYAASPVPEIQAGTAILLGNLALEKKNQESLMLKGVPLLLTMLTETKDPKVRRAVVTALSNVSIIEGFGAKDVWIEKGIELMMPFIEQGHDLQLQIGALNTIANVCNHDKATELKRKVAQLGGIGRLVPLLDSQDEMVVKLAAMTIANMASEDGHRNLMHLLQVEEPLIRLLDSRDEEVQLGVTMAINALADHEATCKDFRVRHAAEPLKELIHISKDRDISKEAKEALAKIAPEEYAALKFKDLSASYTGSSYTSGGESGTYSSSYATDEEEHSDGSDASDSPSDTGSEKRRQLALKREEAKRSEERKAKAEVEKEDARKKVQEDTIAATKGKGADGRTKDGFKLQREETVHMPESDEINSSTEITQETRENSVQIPDEEIRAKRIESGRRVLQNSPSGSEREVEQVPEVSKIRSGDRNSLRKDAGESSNSAVERKRKEEAESDRTRNYQEDYVDPAKLAEKRIREEEERRKTEEAEFRRREELQAQRRAEEEEDLKQTGDEHVDEAAHHESLGRKGKRTERGLRTASIDSVLIPKQPAKMLVQLLRDSKHKKGIPRETLRELEHFASRREKEQLLYGEDVISILVYIICYYPDHEYPDIVAISLYLLALLSRYHVKNQIAIRRARGGEQIIQLILSEVDAVCRNAVLALGAYSLNNKSVQAEVSRVISVLVRFLKGREGKQSSHPTLRAVAACLASITDSNPANQEHVITAGGKGVAQTKLLLDNPNFIISLLAMLSDPTKYDYRDSITNTLVELIKKNRLTKKGLYYADGISKLVPLLETYRDEDDHRTVRVMVNTVYLLYSILKQTKYARKVRSKLIRFHVADTIKPMCAAKTQHLGEVAMSLTKAIENVSDSST